MANIILNIGTQGTASDQLEKYVDVDMSSLYKQFASNVDNAIPAFAKENAKSQDGQIFIEDTIDDAMAIDKTFKDAVDVDYSGYKITKNVNINAVQQAIHNIFSWIPGERIINPEFGTNLRRYLYEGINENTETLIDAEIRECISKWEPRVEIVSITNIGTVNDTENNTMHLQIVYTIPELSDKQYMYNYYYSQAI